ncbi:hypothetical protein ROZALSC1DRAFT_30613 [Rozella allomycis CSF55]|uniref:Uncharacterized protein n=1 Tax=Rozella allomycis (strain CSF55) TaxID=988480 RepID=A0A075AZW2_ROZAC|nr:hypothetical protein O9G_006172 [Rozella allomycis CSF55]RKP17601.1 hypothetical protein ROZALSC1DRAFT_30613 [Rozella allomycis CSF55]|eukprot:EPZ35881.1 hypothetical protein O9G_006172 [Rozella allomycis CSF55]
MFMNKMILGLNIVCCIRFPTAIDHRLFRVKWMLKRIHEIFRTCINGLTLETIIDSEIDHYLLLKMDDYSPPQMDVEEEP